jgi:hypothetical protein
MLRKNLGAESDTLRDLRLDLILAERYTARNITLIARLDHAQQQLLGVSPHCD